MMLLTKIMPRNYQTKLYHSYALAYTHSGTSSLNTAIIIYIPTPGSYNHHHTSEDWDHFCNTTQKTKSPATTTALAFFAQSQKHF
jgi:hypothetical protein